MAPPAPRGKMVRNLKRAGRSSLPYFNLSLRPRPQSRRRSKALADWDGPTHQVTVAGFLRRHWMLEPPEGVQVIDTKVSERTGKTLHCVWKDFPPDTRTVRGPAPTEVKIRQVRR